MDNRDRNKDLDSTDKIDKDDRSSGSWDNEPSRSQSGGMRGDKGRSGSSDIERDIESDSGRGSHGELDH
jgi:hypothetical protein